MDLGSDHTKGSSRIRRRFHVTKFPLKWKSLTDVSPQGDHDGTESPKCQYEECEGTATRVCHHPNCTEKNGNHPLLLCKECDHHIHQDPNASGHLVLDAPKKKNAQSNIAKHLSSPNLLQSEETGHSDQDNTEKDEGVDTGDHPNGVTRIKKTPKPEGDKVRESSETDGGKLKRKKVIKGKRRHTDGVRSHSAGDIYSPVIHGNESDDSEDESNNNYRNSYHGESVTTNKSILNEERTERRPSTPDNCSPHPRYHPISKSMVSHENFTVCFTDAMGGEEDIEVVAAVKHLSLSDALLPMLERRGKDLNNYNAFVEASKTPLPLNCETFLLGGNSLYIREKDAETLPTSGSQSLSKATGAKLTGGKSHNSKNSKAGMSRRDSMAGRIYTLLEPPPNGRQRRSSLQLPFQAFFPSPKGGDGTRANDESSGSLRSRRGINLSIDESIFPMSLSASVSPQGTLRENDSRKTKGQNKLTNLFSPLSKDKEKQDQLSEILNGYSINGLPSTPSLLQIGQPRFNEEVFNIEPHWSSLVDNASDLTKRQHDQQEAIWELLQTELHYIQSLRVIADLFLCVLLNIQNQMLLNEIETEKLLSNIGEIAACNSIFWEMYLCKVVQQSRTYRSPLNPSLIKEGFKKFPELFHPYINYCCYQKSCQEYMKVQYSDNDLFKMFVIWAETQKQCNRLKLSDLLVKPMQRLTKYSLLLQAILRKTDDDIQRKDLLEMIASVDKFVTFVNSTLRKQHEEERLQTIADKIETYDAVDAPNDECLKIIQQYNGNFNLLAPMQGCNPEEIRSLIMQSALKMKDNQSRMDVECLLFTDLLLICKSNKRMDKYKILKPPMRVDRVIVHEIKDKGSFLLIYINEYHVPVSSFTFHADQASVRVWTDHIRKAQTMYHEARQRAIQNLDQPQYLGTEIVEEQIIGYHPLVMPDNPPQLHLTHCDSFESHRDGNIEALTNLEGSEPESHLNRSRSWNDMEQTVDNSSSNSDSKGNYSPLPNKKHKVVQYSNSEPSILKPGEERLQVPSVHSQSLYDESLPDIMDENLRMKLNQRRTSRTEKRYYTADAVQEIQRQEGKDTSIYKRLSWNFGTGEQISEKDNIIRSRIQSSDSLRSVHSSSGVSSTGSLHISPESDICEDIILESNSQDKGVDSNENSSETECTLDRLNEDDYKPSYLIPSVRQSRSKSTSDIVALIQEMSTGDLKDGISSVDLPKTEDQKMKLSHSEFMRMTKKLLLSASDIEASEV